MCKLIHFLLKKLKVFFFNSNKNKIIAFVVLIYLQVKNFTYHTQKIFFVLKQIIFSIFQNFYEN